MPEALHALARGQKALEPRIVLLHSLSRSARRPLDDASGMSWLGAPRQSALYINAENSELGSGHARGVIPKARMSGVTLKGPWIRMAVVKRIHGRPVTFCTVGC